jgi:hypothetical protein
LSDVRRIWYRTSTGTLRSFTAADCAEVIDRPSEPEHERYAVVVRLKKGTEVGITHFPMLAGQAFEIPAASPTPPPAESTEGDRPDPAMFRAYLAAAAGLRQQAIAEELGVSQATVCRYIQRVRAWLSGGTACPGWTNSRGHRDRGSPLWTRTR